MISTTPDGSSRTLSTPALRVENLDDGAIVVVTIDRAHRRNALDSQTLAELHQLLDAINANPTIRVVVLTGSNGSFCAGADIKARPEDFTSTEATPFGGLLRAATSTVAVTMSAQELMASAFEKIHRLRNR